MSDIDIATALRRGLRRLTWATVILYIGLAALFAIGYRDSLNKRADLLRGERQTTSALCSLRRDLQERVTASRDFLAKHPHGIPGVPAATIRSGLVNEQRTIRALSRLVCVRAPQ